jgi:shikimate kinase
LSANCRNVILVGFMGTGKTTVSRILSEQLGWKRVDTDEEIERRTGRTIPDIFREEGEAAFRDKETDALRDVLAGERQVIATGGGAVLREENRRLMRAGGWVVALTADKDSLLRRVAGAGTADARPLLAGDAASRLQALLEARRQAYDFAHATVDTSKRPPEEVAQLLLGWLR